MLYVIIGAAMFPLASPTPPGKPPMEENRKKALAAALGQIEKQFGKGSVMRLGDAVASYDLETVSTGSLGLDIALGIGGLPRGRVERPTAVLTKKLPHRRRSRKQVPRRSMIWRAGTCGACPLLSGNKPGACLVKTPSDRPLWRNRNDKL